MPFILDDTEVNTPVYGEADVLSSITSDARETGIEFGCQVKHLLAERFPGAEVSIDPLNGSQKVSGYLVWQGFEGQEQIDRQRTLGAYLRETLGVDSQKVSTILTYTPQEFHVMATV